MGKANIIVLGGGYAGLRTIHRLERLGVDADLTLVTRRPYCRETTQLHEVAAGTKTVDDITFPIQDVINPSKTKLIIESVESVDTENKTVTLASGGTLSFDYLVLATGFESETFGIEGASEHALPLVGIETAEAAREHLYGKLARYKETGDVRDLTVAVCGGGITAIEYLGELVDIMPSLANRFGFPLEKVRLVCVEAAPALLGMFPKPLANHAVSALERRGVEFKVGTPIKGVKPGAVVYEENGELNEVEASTIVWTTGVRGSHVVCTLGLSCNRNRIAVQSDLSIEGCPNVFVIGDSSMVIDPATNRPFPTTAQISTKQGTYVAQAIADKLAGRTPQPFTFTPAGAIMSLGNHDGIGTVGSMQMKGYLAAIIKKAVINKSIWELGNLKTFLKKSRFLFS